MRLPVYLTVNFCLLLLAVAGTLGVVQRNSLVQAREDHALAAELDRLVTGWDSGGTPAAGRVLRLMVCGPGGESPLTAPEGRPLWTALPGWLRQGASRRAHSELTRRLLTGPRPVSDWYSQGQVWATQRDARMSALSAFLVKARKAQARLTVVTDAAEADLVLAAVAQAGASSTDLVVVEKLVLLGGSPGMLRPALGPPLPVDKPRQVGEWVSAWRAEGGGTSGVQLDVNDRRGRNARVPLGLSEEETLTLLSGMLADDGSMTDYLVDYRALPLTAFPPDPRPRSLAELAEPVQPPPLPKMVAASPRPPAEPAAASALQPSGQAWTETRRGDVVLRYYGQRDLKIWIGYPAGWTAPAWDSLGLHRMTESGYEGHMVKHPSSQETRIYYKHNWHDTSAPFRSPPFNDWATVTIYSEVYYEDPNLNCACIDAPSAACECPHLGPTVKNVTVDGVRARLFVRYDDFAPDVKQVFMLWRKRGRLFKIEFVCSDASGFDDRYLPVFAQNFHWEP